MKKAFDLCIYLSNVKHIQDLSGTLKMIPRPTMDFVDLLDKSLITNQSSLKIISDFMYKSMGLYYEGNIERIYFGQETCENLIPTLKEVQQAYDIAHQLEYEFTLVTPYVSPKGMQILRTIFNYLVTLDEKIEIVVNDFGVLRVINSDYPSLKPILGRLLTKMKRDPRFSLSGFDATSKNINNIKKVETNQKEALQVASLEIPSYLKFLEGKGINRVSFDAVTQGINIKPINKLGIKTDLYWPWVYITSSRSCAIAAYTQTERNYHPTDVPCEFQCKQFEFDFTSDKKMLPSVQRGNALWMNCESLYKDFFEAGFDRLIYQPYIPV